MGTTLTGLTPATTYDSLIKVTDNGPLSGTAKYLSDGLGNDSALALSTSLVGIGTTSGTNRLSISGAGSTALSKISVTNTNTSTTLGLAVSNSIAQAFIGTDTNHPLGLVTNDLERLTITSAGNVGIGTSSPSQPLVVFKSNAADDIGQIIQQGANGTAAFLNIVGNNDAGASFNRITSSTSGGTAHWQIGGGGTASTMVLLTGGTERMRIKSGGSINFNGTDAITEYYFGYNRPTASNLLVNGTNNNKIKIQNAESDIVVLNSNGDSYFNGGNVGIGTTSPTGTYGKLTVAGGIHITNDNNAKLEIGRYSSVVSNSYIKLGANSNSLNITNNTDTADILTIENTGNVGIGTTSPTSKLVVNGDIATSGNIALTGSGAGIFLGGSIGSANGLDDYEEGTWTMGVAFGGASAGIAYFANTGTYTKIGRQVTVNGYISLTSKGSSTGVARITGLPFTIANNNANYTAVSLWLNNVTFANQFMGAALINTTTIAIEELSILGALSSITEADFANNSELMVNLTYFV